MNGAGYQAVHVVFAPSSWCRGQRCLAVVCGHLQGSDLWIAQFAHRLDVLFDQCSGIDDFQRVRQVDAAFFGNGFNFFAFGKQDAAGNAFFVADGGCGDGTRFCTSGRTMRISALRQINQVVTELGGRKAGGFAFCQRRYVFERAA